MSRSHTVSPTNASERGFLSLPPLRKGERKEGKQPLKRLAFVLFVYDYDDSMQRGRIQASRPDFTVFSNFAFRIRLAFGPAEQIPVADQAVGERNADLFLIVGA